MGYTPKPDCKSCPQCWDGYCKLEGKWCYTLFECSAEHIKQNESIEAPEVITSDFIRFLWDRSKIKNKKEFSRQLGIGVGAVNTWLYSSTKLSSRTAGIVATNFRRVL